MEPSEIVKQLYNMPVKELSEVKKKESMLPFLIGLLGIGIVIYGFHQYMKKEEGNESRREQ